MATIIVRDVSPDQADAMYKSLAFVFPDVKIATTIYGTWNIFHTNHKPFSNKSKVYINKLPIDFETDRKGYRIDHTSNDFTFLTPTPESRIVFRLTF